VGKKATVETSRCTSVPTFVEKHRDITSYSKRKGDLPSQREEDPIDMRAVLHRDGSVISAVTLEELNRPDRLYYNLGCKTAVRLEMEKVGIENQIGGGDWERAESRYRVGGKEGGSSSLSLSCI
jgi:(E)-4-hydroxy-3-methylbut-2-enyl-diphosphate synthase